ncbi:MAG: alpha/beta hydrolase [Tepidisphaeraceae bacterium]
MALSEYRFYSKTLEKQVGMYVLLPDTGRAPFATLYLLHGLSDDYTIWLRRTRIEQYVSGLPLAVVMPDGFRGFYTNANHGPAYADYMIHDVVGQAERHFNLKPRRSARCISGLSMGGYGALRLALGYPGTFASAHSHSGALMAGRYRFRKSDEFDRVFGKKPLGGPHDLVELARQAQAANALPALRIDCGTEDFLIDSNRAYTQALTDLGIRHEYEEFPGAHNWDYWDTHIRGAIAFHAKNLKLNRPSVR